MIEETFKVVQLNLDVEGNKVLEHLKEEELKDKWEDQQAQWDDLRIKIKWPKVMGEILIKGGSKFLSKAIWDRPASSHKCLTSVIPTYLKCH